MRMPKFGTKMLDFGILGLEFEINLSICKILRKKNKCLIWVFSGWNLKKILSYLK